MIPFNKKSPVWKYYVCSEDNKLAISLLCYSKIPRGGEGKKAITTSLKNQLQNKHCDQYATLTANSSASGSKNDDTLTSIDSSKIMAVPATSKQKQLTLKETTDSINDLKSIKYHYLIGDMIALDKEPLSLVERVGFNRLMEIVVPQYKMPGRTYMADQIIPDTYNRIYSKIEASISQASAVSVTSDMWTCQNNNQSFLSFTTHWISPDFIFEHAVLAMKPFAGSHTGINIARELNAIAEKWNISHSKIHILVHDSGANMIKGVRDAEYDSAKCFITLLQRVIEEALKSESEITKMIAAAKRSCLPLLQ